MTDHTVNNDAEVMSSVKLTRNAKGDIQYEIKIYNEDPEKAWETAVKLQQKAEETFPGGK